MLFDANPITASGLRHIAGHKYKSTAWTPLDAFLNPMWEMAVKILPMSLAPNAVTSIGTVCLLLSSCVTAWAFVACAGSALPQMSTLTAACTAVGGMPRWVFALNALCAWLYNTLDSIDGKQARRTSSSSPLGQLFDHGCDGLAACLLLTFPLMVACGLLGTSLGWLYFGCLVLTFIAAQWEESVTHEMRTAVNGIFGVTEGNYFIIGVHVAALVGGHALLTSPLVFGLSIGQLIAVGFAGITVRAVGDYAWNVCVTHATPQAALELSSTLGLALVPYLAQGTSAAWVVNHPAWFVGVALAHAHIITQTVIFAMAHQPQAIVHPATAAPLAAVLAGAVLGRSSWLAAALLYACTALTAAAYAHFVASSIQQITARLGIYCFSLASRAQQ